MENAALAICADNPVQQLAHDAPQGTIRSGLGFSQHRPEHGKHLLDWVVVRAARRQVHDCCPGWLARLLNASHFMDAQVIHHYDFVGRSPGSRNYYHPGANGGPIDRVMELPKGAPTPRLLSAQTIVVVRQ